MASQMVSPENRDAMEVRDTPYSEQTSHLLPITYSHFLDKAV